MIALRTFFLLKSLLLFAKLLFGMQRIPFVIYYILITNKTQKKCFTFSSFLVLDFWYLLGDNFSVLCVFFPLWRRKTKYRFFLSLFFLSFLYYFCFILHAPAVLLFFGRISFNNKNFYFHLFSFPFTKRRIFRFYLLFIFKLTFLLDNIHGLHTWNNNL